MDGNGKCEIPIVSFINLIATPERFHNRKVVVTGHARIVFEDVSLAFTKGAGAQESLWMVFDNGPLKTNEDADRAERIFKEWQKKFNNKYLIVEGVFDMTLHGHGGIYPGSLRNISQIEVVAGK